MVTLTWSKRLARIKEGHFDKVEYEQVKRLIRTRMKSFRRGLTEVQGAVAKEGDLENLVQEFVAEYLFGKEAQWAYIVMKANSTNLAEGHYYNLLGKQINRFLANLAPPREIENLVARIWRAVEEHHLFVPDGVDSIGRPLMKWTGASRLGGKARIVNELALLPRLPVKANAKKASMLLRPRDVQRAAELIGELAAHPVGYEFVNEVVRRALPAFCDLSLRLDDERDLLRAGRLGLDRDTPVLLAPPEVVPAALVASQELLDEMRGLAYSKREDRTIMTSIMFGQPPELEDQHKARATVLRKKLKAGLEGLARGEQAAFAAELSAYLDALSRADLVEAEAADEAAERPSYHRA